MLDCKRKVNNISDIPKEKHYQIILENKMRTYNGWSKIQEIYIYLSRTNWEKDVKILTLNVINYKKNINFTAQEVNPVSPKISIEI